MCERPYSYQNFQRIKFKEVWIKLETKEDSRYYLENFLLLVMYLLMAKFIKKSHTYPGFYFRVLKKGLK